MKRIVIISAFVMGLGAVTSCDNYLDINQDPNSPAEENMTVSIMLPAAEMNIAGSYGDFMRISGGYFAQYYVQLFGTTNYLDYSRFQMSATRSSSAYTQLMSRGLNTLETVRKLAEADEDWGTYLAATTLRAFTYQILVDAYGEVPYKEAFDVNNAAPAYDDGLTIYEGVIAELDDALSKANASDMVATNFLFPGENATNWIKFANAVKLKLLSRESGVASVDAQIGAIISEGNLPTEDVAYKDCWSNESGAMSPFYAEEFSTAWGSTQTNVVANIAIIGTMQQKDADGNVVYEDPRLPVFFETNSNGEYTGGVSGTNFSNTDTYKATYWCRPVASYDMPVYLITKSEIEFFISEYYARQGNKDQEAEAHYKAAIEESFNTAGVSGADANIQQFPYDASKYKQSIGVSKWVALAGVNTFEAWCEMRRLDYPAFGSVSGSDIYNDRTDDSYKPELYVPGTLYTPIQVFGQIGDNHLLERWPYAESSSSRNGNSPAFPGYTSPVFWGK